MGHTGLEGDRKYENKAQEVRRKHFGDVIKALKGNMLGMSLNLLKRHLIHVTRKRKTIKGQTLSPVDTATRG